MNHSYNFLESQRLLIKPFERILFVIAFILVTVVSQIICYWIFNQVISDTLAKDNSIYFTQYSILYASISGLFLGFAQWLIVRKYIPDYRWILVVGATTVFTLTTQTMVRRLAESLINSNKSLNGLEYVTFGLFYWSFGIGIYLVAGWLQWHILSRYVEKARWWILIPTIAAMTTFLFVICSYLFKINLFNISILSLSLLPAIQSIGFCILKKKSVHERPIFESSLALAPDIVNYGEIQKLENLLRKRISQIWRTDLEESLKPMKYLVGVNSTGTQIVYEPINQAAIDHVNQTPLPELAGHHNNENMGTETLPNLAKFKVVFSPPVSFQIYSWRGIPLLWLGLAVGIAIVGISVLFAWFAINLFPVRTAP